MNDVLIPAARQFGRYTILRELRRGRSSATYLASDPVMHREVVLKTVELPPPNDGRIAGEETDTTPIEKAFIRQAQAAGKLHHPHIVTVFDAGRVHQTGYLAIEKVSGRPLHELITGGFRPNLVHCASIAARVADAIEYAHSQGVAHRHLRPQHVLLSSDGAPKIEGFGGWIDSGAAGEEALDATEHMLPYFQNEVNDEDRRRDIRAIGGLLYAMLTGRAPVAKPEPVSTLRPDVPPTLAQIVDETLGMAATGAHRSAGDLRDALTAYIWNARKENVAPATIGIPLSAPPRELPADGLAAATISPRTRPRTQARVVAPPPPPPPPPGLAGLWQRARPWLIANRLWVILAVGFIGLGLLVGLILGLTAGSGRAPPKAAAEPAAVAPAAVAPVGTGVVRLDVQPWGEVFVDSKPIGVSPPLVELKLPAGRHTIEIRHGEKAAVSAQVDIDPAQPLQIRHRFE